VDKNMTCFNIISVLICKRFKNAVKAQDIFTKYGYYGTQENTENPI
jgi:hypothetical protein